METLHRVSKDTYVAVEPAANNWVHTRLMHGKERPHPIYKAVYACPAKELPNVLDRARNYDHNVWGADEDY